MEFAERLRIARARKFKGPSEAARALGLKQARYSHYENSRNEPDIKVVAMMARRFRVSFEWLAAGTGSMELNAQAQLIGNVGAGEQIVRYDEHDIELIDAPPGLVNARAAVVKGMSGGRVYREGDTIFWSERELDLRQMLRKDCIVQIKDGPLCLKQLVRGTKENVYTLRSFNPDYADIVDVKVQSAAPVEWVRRTGG